jgi:hypothetical protein
MKYLALLLLAACASGPVFEDAPASGRSYSSTLVESRIGDPEYVHRTCYWKSREAGAKVHGSISIKGCAFSENGRAVILWIDPKSFANHEGMEVAGHELYHQHNFINHK